MSYFSWQLNLIFSMLLLFDSNMSTDATAVQVTAKI